MTDNNHSRSKQGLIRRMKTIPEMNNVHEEKNGNMSTRLDHLIEAIRTATSEKFTGYIKVNYTQGSIGRVEKFEEILRK
jgi:hypothetical protein